MWVQGGMPWTVAQGSQVLGLSIIKTVTEGPQGFRVRLDDACKSPGGTLLAYICTLFLPGFTVGSAELQLPPGFWDTSPLGKYTVLILSL